jgi:hypothetical protein
MQKGAKNKAKKIASQVNFGVSWEGEKRSSSRRGGYDFLTDI